MLDNGWQISSAAISLIILCA